MAIRCRRRSRNTSATSRKAWCATLIWGTPQAEALAPKLEADRIPGTSPGFGAAAAANGAKFPYVFPIAATYWSQAGAAIQFVKDKLGGDLKGKKIAYLYYDNPAGLVPMPILDQLQKSEGFQLRTFAVPPPRIEMGAQILDITRTVPGGFRHHARVRARAGGGNEDPEAVGLSDVACRRVRVGLI